MTLAAEKEMKHLGETSGCADHDHDLVHELSRRLDSLWRIDQYIANAKGHDALVSFWQTMKRHHENDVGQLKQLIAKEVHQGCF